MDNKDFHDLFSFGRFDNRKVSMTTMNKNKALNTAPHYTDKRFKKQQTVFGREPNSIFGHKGLSYVYDDRLWQWDREKTKAAYEIAKESGKTPRSCAYYEVFLSAWYDKPVVIEHIAAGVNVSSGYPYFVLGYREVEQEDEETAAPQV